MCWLQFHANNLLSKNLVPKRFPAFYVFAVIFNVFARLNFIFTISPSVLALLRSPDIVTTLSASLEVIRRFVWNLIRLESEQRGNAERFRVLNGVPLEARQSLTQRIELRSMKMRANDDDSE